MVSVLQFQVIIYFFGPGGSGKPQLIRLIIALLREHAILSPTLEALSSDQFEIVNLSGKKLVLIHDISGEIKDTHIIKAYSGQGLLRGRKIRVQGTDMSCLLVLF